MDDLRWLFPPSCNLTHKEQFQELDSANRRAAIIVYLFGVAAISALILLAFLLFPRPAHSEEITEAQAVQCIMGEARGEGYASMLAHAEAIRNRGTLKGVYGCRAQFTEPAYVWEKARKAWRESANTRTVKGADHWGSLKVDGGWIKRMEKAGYVRTATIKNTAFYRRDGR